MNNRLKVLAFGIICLVALNIFSNDQSNSKSYAKSETSTGFIHTSGTKLLDGSNKEFIAKGISLGNDAYTNPATPPQYHHNENSYKELSKLGFNSVRFYLNYGVFEDDSNPYVYKQSGWDWLDQNIKWAEKYNIKLVLNMHYPQGGYQSGGDGMELWTDKSNQKRLIALWTEIAKRYKNKTTIMAFALLNEPIVPQLSTEEKTFNQWKNLATKIVAAIRKVDKNHMIIVECLNRSIDRKTGQQYYTNSFGTMNFFLLKDKNIAYEFHIYDPTEFTHQNASWIDTYKDMFLKYPDYDFVQVVGNSKWLTFTDKNPTLPYQSTGWTYLQGTRFKIEKPEYMYALPTYQAANIGSSGSVWFDDITLKEYDENNRYIRNISVSDFSNSSIDLWQAGSSKGYSKYDTTVGHNRKGSLNVSATTEDANVSFYNPIRLQQGYSYEISGYVRCENLSSSSVVRIRLDLYSCDGIYSRDKDYLKTVFEPYMKFGKENNVPLYLGEFGCISDSFK